MIDEIILNANQINEINSSKPSQILSPNKQVN